MSEEPYGVEDLFQPSWWDRFACAWNESDYCHSLAGLGVVTFETSDSSIPTVSLEWDSEGRVRRLPDVNEAAPRFTATKDDWLAFIRGEFTATMGVIRGRISFDGQLRSILSYSAAFNNLAIVARNLLPEQGGRSE